MEPPVDVVDHLGNIVFTWNGNDAFAGDEAGEESGLAPMVFSVLGSRVPIDGSLDLPRGKPWYADGMRVNIDRCFAFDFNPLDP